eukprot:TRINITY_DN58_c0_g1_i4.p1 TRINITY_DN58_c0_g1~~TRINITY_DN58_c0_g1_i4.p1  ORF type:complete len:232 (-),score=46.05 TRINITY_DN58_c0_g1_i4:650-1345(-)
MKRIQNPLTWQCGRCMLTYGYGRDRGYTTVDDYNFKLEDAQQYYGDSAVKKYAQLTYLWRPHGCLATDTTNEWCDLTSYWRAYDPVKDSGIPYCRQSFCWFQPGAECLARIPRWVNVDEWQKQLVKDQRLKEYLQRIVPPMGNIVTKCYDKELLRGLKCPMEKCEEVKTTKRSAIFNRFKRQSCSTRMTCSRCAEGGGDGQKCVGGDPFGRRLCCDCILDLSFASTEDLRI